MIVASLITCSLAVIVLGLILARVTPRDERWWMAFCVAATAPLCWIMFHGVRMPLDGWLKAALGEGELLWWIRTTYAPLTEEPAKLWPLLLPMIRRKATPQSAARYALALGAGFALGEVWTVAGIIATRKPEIAALPWHQLLPFITERLQTFIVHGGLTAIVLACWRKGPGFLPGLLLAMLAHWLGNFPIGMAQRSWLGPNPAVSQAIVSLWVSLGCATAFVWLLVLDIGQVGIGRAVHGRAICPQCGQDYDRRLIGFNFGDTRYEPCPRCRKWHWTKTDRRKI